MRYAILVFLLTSFASLYKQPPNGVSGMTEQSNLPVARNDTLANQTLHVDSQLNLAFNAMLMRPKRSANKLFVGNAKKLRRRKAKRLKLKRYLRKELRKAEKKRTSQLRKGMHNAKRRSREEDSKALHDATQENQNELLASVDDLPKQSSTVEISIKDPGLCKVDGVPMCKHDGECMSRDEGGAPVFFCACPPAWGGDFCHERRDPCAAGLPDCGSMFRCRRDELNRAAGFSCDCHGRLGWTRRSESDPRCIRITNCSEGNPCQNGGSCRQEEGGFVCVCTEHSSGDLCEHPVSAAAAVAGPAVSRIAALLAADRSTDDLSSLLQRRDAGPGGPAAGGGAAYHGAVSAEYGGPPALGSDGRWAERDAISAGSSGEWAGQRDDNSDGFSNTAPELDTSGVAARYGGVISASYGSPPAVGDGRAYLNRRAANTAAGWPGYGYYNALYEGPSDAAAGYGDTPLAGYDRTNWPEYDISAGRLRRSQGAVGRQPSRRRRQQQRFLERLLRDVEPQIRRTARDSVIELPRR